MVGLSVVLRLSIRAISTNTYALDPFGRNEVRRRPPYAHRNPPVSSDDVARVSSNAGPVCGRAVAGGCRACRCRRHVLSSVSGVRCCCLFCVCHRCCAVLGRRPSGPSKPAPCWVASLGPVALRTRPKKGKVGSRPFPPSPVRPHAYTPLLPSVGGAASKGLVGPTAPFGCRGLAAFRLMPPSSPSYRLDSARMCCAVWRTITAWSAARKACNLSALT